jgi:RNAse (barnase) inhibitor barstar
MGKKDTKTTVDIDQIIFRADLYPQIEHDAALVQKYAENLDVLPPIEVNQHNEYKR